MAGHTEKIAIHRNDDIFRHSGNWNIEMIRACERLGIKYEAVDCYKNNFIIRCGDYSALCFCPGNFVYADKMQSANILEAARRKGVKTFPNHNTIWHFDDKIAEMYAFLAIDAPAPKSWAFYLLDECLEWLRVRAEYPIVAKLRCGSGSNGVKLLKSKSEAAGYAKKMFRGGGFDPSPSLLYKAYSKAQSSKDWTVALARIKRIPEFLNTRRHAKMLSREKGVHLLTYDNVMRQLSSDIEQNAFSALSFHWGMEHTNYPAYAHISLVEKLSHKKI